MKQANNKIQKLQQNNKALQRRYTTLEQQLNAVKNRYPSPELFFEKYYSKLIQKVQDIVLASLDPFHNRNIPDNLPNDNAFAKTVTVNSVNKIARSGTEQPGRYQFILTQDPNYPLYRNKHKDLLADTSEFSFMVSRQFGSNPDASGQYNAHTGPLDSSSSTYEMPAVLSLADKKVLLMNCSYNGAWTYPLRVIGRVGSPNFTVKIRKFHENFTVSSISGIHSNGALTGSSNVGVGADAIVELSVGFGAIPEDLVGFQVFLECNANCLNRRISFEMRVQHNSDVIVDSSAMFVAPEWATYDDEKNRIGTGMFLSNSLHIEKTAATTEDGGTITAGLIPAGNLRSRFFQTFYLGSGDDIFDVTKITNIMDHYYTGSFIKGAYGVNVPRGVQETTLKVNNSYDFYLSPWLIYDVDMANLGSFFYKTSGLYVYTTSDVISNARWFSRNTELYDMVTFVLMHMPYMFENDTHSSHIKQIVGKLKSIASKAAREAIPLAEAVKKYAPKLIKGTADAIEIAAPIALAVAPMLL